MDAERIRRISQRAYELWEQGGRRDGGAEGDWLRAEQEEGRPGSEAGPAGADAAAEAGTPKRAARAGSPQPAVEAAVPPARPKGTSAGGKPGGKPRPGRPS